MVTRLTIANRPCIPTSVAAVLASLAMLACRLASQPGCEASLQAIDSETTYSQ